MRIPAAQTARAQDMRRAEECGRAGLPSLPRFIMQLFHTLPRHASTLLPLRPTVPYVNIVPRCAHRRTLVPAFPRSIVNVNYLTGQPARLRLHVVLEAGIGKNSEPNLRCAFQAS